jgi:hypothetical protein
LLQPQVLALFISKIKNLLPAFQRKLLWSLPKNQSIVILDEGGSEYLIPSLGNTEYFILKKRSTIYLKYLLAAIFFDMQTKIRDLSYCYNARMIERLNPILIITYISNCPLYWRLDKGFKKGKFLTVQNSNHFINSPPNLPKDYQHSFLEKTPYFTHLACISKYDVDYFSKMAIEVENYYPIGTVRASKYMAGFSKKSKIFDFCIVTNSLNSRPENIKLWEYILKYIETHNVTACLALKRNSTEGCFKAHIEGLEKFYASSKVKVIEQNKDSTQNASDISKVTIGSHSTVLRQTFSRGNKIYPINFVHSAMSPPYHLLGYPLDPTYDKFHSHLDYLLAMDQKVYSERYRELMKYLDIFSPENPPTKKLENLIKELVSSSKLPNSKGEDSAKTV